MSKKIRIGILGCANIAKKYTINAFKSLDNAEVISIASRTQDKAKEFASIFSIPFYESYDEILKNPQVDAVYIPLPIGLHKEWIIKTIQSGKHVLSEKSLTTDFSSAKKIIESAKHAKIVLYENFMCDFHPQHQKVLSLIKKGSIGKPFIFKSYFGIPQMNEENFRYKKNLGGSALYEVGAYPVFMSRKIFQSEPLWVEASLFFDKEKDIDIQGVAQLGFKDEKIAHIAFSLNAVYQNNYSLWGQHGIITVKRAYAIPPTMKPEIELSKNENLQESIISIDVPAANHFELLFRDFCTTILEHMNSSKKINEVYTKILYQAKILEAIKISSLEKRRVLLIDII